METWRVEGVILTGMEDSTMLAILLTVFFIVMLFLAIAISHAGAVADQRLEEYYRQLKTHGH